MPTPASLSDSDVELIPGIQGMSKYACDTSIMELYADLYDTYEPTIGSVLCDVAKSVLCESIVA